MTSHHNLGSLVINLKDDADSLSGKSLNFGKVGNLSTKEAKKVVDDFNAAMQKANVTQKEYLKTISNPGMKAYLSTMKGGTATVEGYTASLKSMTVASRAAALGMRVLATALNMIIIIGVTMAIEAIIKAIDKAVTTTKEHQEKLADLKSQYSEITTQLGDLHDKLDDTQSKIEELKGKGKLTLLEQDELKKLETANSDLERQIELEKIQKQQKGEEARKEFVNTMDSDLKKNGEYYKSVSGDFSKDKGHGREAYDDTDEEAYLNNQVKEYQDHYAKLKTAQENYLSTKDASYKKEADDEQTNLDNIKSYLTQKQQDFATASSGIEKVDNPVTDEDKKNNAWLDSISKFNNQIIDMFGDADARVENFKSALNDTNLSIFSDGLKEIAKTTGLTVDILKDDKYKGFIDALVKAGVISDDSATELQKVADAFNAISNESDGATDAVESVSSSISTLSERSSDIKLLNQAFNDFKEKGSVAFSTVADIADKFKDVEGLDGYLSKLLDTNTTSQELNETLSDLTYAYIAQKIPVEQLANMTEDEVSAMLRENGVTNDATVASKLIKNAKLQLAIASFDLANATGTDIDAFILEAQKMGLTASEAVALKNAYIIAQNAMNAAVSSGVAARLRALGVELNGIRSLAAAYAAIRTTQKLTTATGTEFARHLSSSNPDALAIADVGAAWDKVNSITIPTAPSVGKVSYGGGGSGGSSGKSGKGSGGSGGGSSAAVEEYVADIDKLYEGKTKLEDIQTAIKRIQSINEVSKVDTDKIKNLNQIIDLYKKEETAVHDLAEQNRGIIQDEVKTLAGEGFKIDYDKDTNKLLVENMEHINELGKNEGLTQEKINDKRKAAEKLLEDIKSRNQDNVGYSQDWLDLVKDISSAYEDIKNASEDAAKKWVDAAQKVADTTKDAFDKANDSVEATIDAVLDKIDAEKKILQAQEDALKERKTNLETAVSYVTKTIQDRIDALKDENDELDKQLKVKQALEALDKAKNQKTSLIYEEGVGFKYSADQAAINEAQESYDSVVRDYDLDNQIKELEDYKKKWQEVIDNYQENVDKATADGILTDLLGDNWSAKVSNLNTSFLGKIEHEYDNVCKGLDDSVDGSVASQIKNLDTLADKWKDAKDDIKNQITAYTGDLSTLKSFESSNYTDRLKLLSAFTSTAVTNLKSLKDAADDASKALAGAQTNSDTVQNSTSGYDASGDLGDKIVGAKTLEEAQAYAAQRDAKIVQEHITGVDSTQYFLDKWKANAAKSSSSGYDSSVDYGTLIRGASTLEEAQSYANQRDAKMASEHITDATSSQSFLTEWKTNHPNASSGGSSSGGSSHSSSDRGDKIAKTVSGIVKATTIIGKLFGFSEGGVADHTGLAMLHGTQSTPELILNNADVGKIYNYIHNTPSLVNDAIAKIVSGNNLSKLGVSHRTESSVNMTIGDIYVSGVDNVDEMVSAVKAEFPTKMLQSFYRK